MENKMATPCVSKSYKFVYRNLTINEKVKDHFKIIAKVEKIILKWLLKTVFEGVDWVHMTQNSGR